MPPAAAAVAAPAAAAPAAVRVAGAVPVVPAALARLSFAILPTHLSIVGFGFGPLTHALISEALRSAPAASSQDGRRRPRSNGPTKLLRVGLVDRDTSLPEIGLEDREMPRRFDVRLRWDHVHTQSVLRLLLGVLMNSSESSMVTLRTSLRRIYLGRCLDIFEATPMPAGGYGPAMLNQLSAAFSKFLVFLFRNM